MYLYDYKVAGIGELAWYENVYKEIWFDHEYSRYGVEVEKNDIVVDCGANVGFFTLYALNKGAKFVFSIECDDRNIDSLSYNLEGKNASISKEYVGFGDKNVDIEKIFQIINKPFIDFIKIDIEWAEYDLLLNTPDYTMKRINKWVIEVHDLYSHYYKIFQIIEKFSKNGFDINLEHVHKDTNLALLYAKRR